MMLLPHPGAMEGALSAALIHPSAWKGNSPNSVNKKFGEFRTARSATYQPQMLMAAKDRTPLPASRSADVT
jgi:hypothetical protein